MTDVLIFRLFGPFASWGEVAVGEIRPTATRPTRSAILGLLAAALGIDRQDDHQHEALSAAVRLATRVDLAGLAMVDYQTINWRKPRRKDIFLTRADQLRVARTGLQTIQSTRHYRCDALATVAIVVAHDASPQQETWLLRLRKALERPHFTLSLGRKACPPALPMAPRIVVAESLIQAFAQYDADLAAIKEGLPGYLRKQRAATHAVDIAWDEDLPITTGIDPTTARIEHRRDQPTSRERWRFESRAETVASVDTAIFLKRSDDVSEPSFSA